MGAPNGAKGDIRWMTNNTKEVLEFNDARFIWIDRQYGDTFLPDLPPLNKPQPLIPDGSYVDMTLERWYWERVYSKQGNLRRRVYSFMWGFSWSNSLVRLGWSNKGLFSEPAPVPGVDVNDVDKPLSGVSGLSALNAR
jgi:hypothetical protein